MKLSSPEVNYSKTVYIICLIGALGGLLFGLDQGFIANSLSTINSVYDLTIEQGEHYSAVLAWGGVLGALFSGVLSRKLGRKKVLILAGFAFSLLSSISACLPIFFLLTLCRFGLGIAVGVASFTVPLYLAETSPTQIRGGMSTLFQIMITVGIFLISFTNVFIVKIFGQNASSLKLMFLVIVFFSLMMFVGSVVLPESPRWLVLKGDKESALKVLSNLRSCKAEINTELQEILDSISHNQDSSLNILKKFYFWRVLSVGITMQMLQQLVGINMMICYAPTIFSYVKMTGVLHVLAIPTLNMLFTFPVIKWIEKWGRKKLLYIGSIIMMITMFLNGLMFIYFSSIELPNYFSTIILLFSAIIYIFGFSCSWGPVTWLICSEIFPLQGRELGMTITTIVSWLFSGIVMGNVLSFMNDNGNHSIFFLFSFFCLLSIFFLKVFVPETKGISLENIEKNLKKGRKIRDIGFYPLG